jgi:hypothetical protein
MSTINRGWGSRIGAGWGASMGKGTRGRPAIRLCRAPHLHFVLGTEAAGVSLRVGFGTGLGLHSSTVRLREVKEGLPSHG